MRAPLRQLAAGELAAWPIAPGDIYWRKADGKKLRLRRAGDLLDGAWLAKFAPREDLWLAPVANVDAVNGLALKLKVWCETTDGKRFEQARQDFAEALRTGLRSTTELSLLDWALVCQRSFKFDDAVVQEFQDKHIVLYRRGLLVSGLAVAFSLACGYEDVAFLREIYRTAWLLDLGLVDQRFTYWVALACQHEKARPGAGDAFLKEKGASAAELELFLTHPELGHQRALLQFGESYSFPELLGSIRNHHEKADGTGFPQGLSLSGLADWQTLVILADHMVDYREEVLEKNLAESFAHLWAAYQRQPLADLPVGDVIAKLKVWLNNTYNDEEAA